MQIMKLSGAAARTGVLEIEKRQKYYRGTEDYVFINKTQNRTIRKWMRDYNSSR